MKTWHANKVFGLGYYTGHRLGIPGLSQTQSNIDNTWLETMVDVGLLGLVSLASFALSGFVRLVRTRELTGDWRLWAVGVTVYGLAISFVNPTIQAPGAAQVIIGFLLVIVLPQPGGVRGSWLATETGVVTRSEVLEEGRSSRVRA